jgi:type I restriction enzyme M protein
LSLNLTSPVSKALAYDELLKPDKVSLDIFWLKDESLENSANLPDPDAIATEIAEDLQAALDQFSQIASDLALSKANRG